MSSPIYRIIDANVNRAREALRVVEDCARFAWNDPIWSAQLKSLRHRLTRAVGNLGIGPELLAFRDTPGDVGTGQSEESERRRSDVPAVVAANLKRAQEAVRVLEEYSKLVSEPAGGAFKQIRYDLYTIETALAARLAAPERLASARLYVLVTSSMTRGRDPVDVARQAIAGGADVIQLREKEMPDGQFIELARRMRSVCRETGALFIVNDRAHVAQLVDADGVHVGQDDLPAADARRLLGPGRIVGVSTHSPAQAERAIIDGASYVGVGPVNATPTKPTTDPVGLEYVRYAAENIAIPFFAIGGVTARTADDILRAGARRLAVCSAIISADDVAAAAAEIKTIASKYPH
ncbi:MAG TPA: thiamine phosphate synthase [Planctomycetota bacterium]|nr:thiamine phosphate synthase [Planctomycetota bacterium]